jgi:hypothetical protein
VAVASGWPENEEVVARGIDTHAEAHGIYGARLAEDLCIQGDRVSCLELEQAPVAGCVKLFRFEGFDSRHVVHSVDGTGYPGQPEARSGG